MAGFDDISMAALTAPTLSTVALPLREMGRLGFLHADRALAGDAPEPVVLPTVLAMRGSTGAPPAVALPAAIRPAHSADGPAAAPPIHRGASA